MSSNLRRDFSTREELAAYLTTTFPLIAARGREISDTRGGRIAAEQVLGKIDPVAYGRTRNALSGAVTRLAPYLRHGVLSLSEARTAALASVTKPNDAYKLVQEFAWRDYWQRLYGQIGDAIWHDREPYKTGFGATDYARDVPDDIREGRTGLACIDAFAKELRETGYLHNHVRMWVAGYVVHVRHVRWQAGACWFLEHLLDGDPASNNLSWQWIASTFSHKPYFFNRENVEKYTNGKHCRVCPLVGRCDFEGSYEQVALRLFPHNPPELRGRR